LSPRFSNRQTNLNYPERRKLTLEKEGYDKEEVNIEGDANAWYIAGNLVFGGLIGWLIVDPATGAMLAKPVNDPVYFCKGDFKEHCRLKNSVLHLMRANMK
jgi:hypothetical protein